MYAVNSRELLQTFYTRTDSLVLFQCFDFLSHLRQLLFHFIKQTIFVSTASKLFFQCPDFLSYFNQLLSYFRGQTIFTWASSFVSFQCLDSFVYLLQVLFDVLAVRSGVEAVVIVYITESFLRIGSFRGLHR